MQLHFSEGRQKTIPCATGYPRPRWELPMDLELEFIDKHLDFYTPPGPRAPARQEGTADLEVPQRLRGADALFDWPEGPAQ